MIGQCLSNKNESAMVSKSKKKNWIKTRPYIVALTDHHHNIVVICIILWLLFWKAGYYPWSWIHECASLACPSARKCLIKYPIVGKFIKLYTELLLYYYEKTMRAWISDEERRRTEEKLLSCHPPCLHAPFNLPRYIPGSGVIRRMMIGACSSLFSLFFFQRDELYSTATESAMCSLWKQRSIGCL